MPLTLNLKTSNLEKVVKTRRVTETVGVLQFRMLNLRFFLIKFIETYDRLPIGPRSQARARLPLGNGTQFKIFRPQGKEVCEEIPMI